MPEFSKLVFRLKGVSIGLKFLFPLLAVMVAVGCLLNWHSKAKNGREKFADQNAETNLNQARFDLASCGDGWDNRLAGGANGDVLAIAVDAGGNVYFGGDFTQIGGIAANHIARWNGLNWSALGAGTDEYVSTIAIAGGDIYAGGEFKNAGGVSAKYIARWNGANWSALGAGADGNVASIAVAGGDIYAGGYFTNAGGAAANYIARWDGANWSALGNGTSDIVTKIAASGNNVYAGGFFESAGGISANHIAKWDGANWSALGVGTDGDVYALAVSGNDLYVGGGFYSAGGAVNTTRIAKWNGASWSSLGSGANNTIYSLAASGGDVYASGYFTKTGQVSANRVGRWNGSGWSTLDGGTNGAAIALAADGSDVYAGGFFSTAGCHASNRIAKYFLQSFSGSGGNDWHNAANWMNGAIPNVNSDVNIGAADTVISVTDATIRDLRVDEGRTLTVAANRVLIVKGNLNLLGNINGAGTLVVNNCSPEAISRGAGAGYIRLALTRCVNNSGAFNFPVGTANGYSPVQISNVAGSGNFTVKANQGAYSAAVLGLSLNRLQRFWDLTNGGIGSADVQFDYLSGDISGTEADYKVVRINGATAENMFGTINTTNHQATVTNVSSFSPWTLGEIVAPTTAMVSVGGKVSSLSGRGIFGARVTLIRSNGEIRRAQTNPFGFYNFKNVVAGETYTIQVAHKTYTFAPGVVNVIEDLDGLNFTADPR